MKQLIYKNVLVLMLMLASATLFAQTKIGNLYFKVLGGKAYVIPEIQGTPYYKVGKKPTGDIIVPAKVEIGGTEYNVAGVADNAFNGCDGITSITLPEGMNGQFGQSAFQGCTGLKSIVIPENISRINQSAFQGCTGLISIIIPKNTTDIGTSAFSGCTALVSVTILKKSTTTSFGVDVFKDCPNLKVFTNLNATPVDISSSDIFTNLTTRGNISLYVTSGSESTYNSNGWTGFSGSAQPVFINTNGYIVSDPDSNTLVKYVGTDQVLDLSTTISNIAPGAFADNQNIKNVILPTSLTDIGTSAFEGCKHLSTVVVKSENSLGINTRAFAGCTGLSSFSMTAVASAPSISTATTTDEQFAGVTRENVSLFISGNKTDYGNAGWSGFKFSTRYYVNGSSVASGTDGTSWDDAFPSLQSALDQIATTGDYEIWVAKGTYEPTNELTTGQTRTKTFAIQGKETVRLYGGFAGGSTTGESTIEQRDKTKMHSDNKTTLSGDIGTANDASDNAYHVLYIENTNITIDGFTISGGNADATSGINNTDGGGIYITNNAKITLTNNIIKENSAKHDGGGIYLKTNSSITFIKNDFISNITNNNGGAIFLNSQSSSIHTFKYNKFESNSSPKGTGGAIEARGITGTIYHFTNNIFKVNTAGSLGGAISASSTNVTYNYINNTFYANKANDSGDRGGGAICGYSGTHNIYNNIFSNNKRGDNTNVVGADVWRFKFPATSTSPSPPEAIMNNVKNNILQENSLFLTEATNIKVTDASTIFTDASTGVFSLTTTSPAINTGDNAHLTDIDLDKDFVGNTRTQVNIVDMGAYESDQKGTPIISIENVTKTYGEVAFAPDVNKGESLGAVTFSVSLNDAIEIISNKISIKKATTSPIQVTATVAEDANFNEASKDFDVTVNKKELTVTGLTANNKVYDGTTTGNITGTASLSGTVSKDAVTLSTGTGAFVDKTVGTNKTVTFSGYGISGKDAGNYTLSQPSNQTANITVKAVTIRGLTANNKVYDGTATGNITGTASLVGTVSGDAVTLSTGTGVFADKTVGTGKTVTFSGYSISGTDAGNYTLSQPSNQTGADITAKGLTITGLTANNKVYDGNATGNITGTASLVGTVSGDAVTLTTGVGTGAFADKIVGTGKTVTFSGYSITGADKDNYTLSQPANQTANITKKELTVTADDISRKFGEENPTTFTVSYSGFVAGEDAQVLKTAPTASTTAQKDSKAGKYAITVSGGEAANYRFKYVNGTLTVNKANQTITFTQADVTYKEGLKITLNGKSDSGLGVEYTLVSGDGTLSGNILTVKNAGEFKIKAEQSGNDNYEAAKAVEVTFVVIQNDPKKENQTISFIEKDNVKYDGQDIVLNAVASSKLAISYTLVTGEGSITGNVLKVTKAGEFKVRAEQEGNDKFNPAPVVTLTLKLRNLKVKVLGKNNTTPDKVDVYLFEKDKLGKDTLAIKKGITGGLIQLNVPAKEFIVLADAKDYVATYYEKSDSWSTATGLTVSKDTSVTINLIKIERTIDKKDDGNLEGVVWEEYDDQAGRILAKRRAKRRKCGLRKRRAGGRTAEDKWELFAYGETDDEGKFEFGFLPQGTYRFFVEFPGIPMDEDSETEFTVGESKGVTQKEFKLVVNIEGDKIEVKQEKTLGVVEALASYTVYPNPATDYIYVQALEVAKVRVLDMSGKLILEGKTNESIAINQLTKGIYVIFMEINGQQISHKFTKK